jgi:hypothetical protein
MRESCNAEISTMLIKHLSRHGHPPQLRGREEKHSARIGMEPKWRSRTESSQRASRKIQRNQKRKHKTSVEAPASRQVQGRIFGINNACRLCP